MSSLFICSDIHGDSAALDAALAAFTRSGASHFVCLGDVLNHGPRNPIPQAYNPLLVAEKLNAIAEKVIAVRGNCDSEVDQALCRFPLLADYNQMLMGARKLFLTHGHLFHGDKLPPLAQGDIFASGHTHIPTARLHEGIYHFNPGSISMPRENWPASYGVINHASIQVRNLFDDSLLCACDLSN